MTEVNHTVCRIYCAGEFENTLAFVTFVMPLSSSANLSETRHYCVLIRCEMCRELHINKNNNR